MTGRRAAVAGVFLLTSSCNLAPTYRVPATFAAPAAWRDSGPWTPAAPADTAPRGDWWTMFGDPVLNRLEARVDGSNQQVAVYLARHDQALGAARTARGYLFPEIDAGANGLVGRQLMYGEEHAYEGTGSLSYEVDLWGRIRNAVAAARLDAQASAADLASVRLSIEAELADTYLSLRGEDALLALLRQTVAAYASAMELTQKLYAGGAAAEVDVDRARTQVFDAQSQLEQAAAARAEYVHAVADLVGADPAEFVLPLGGLPPAPPPIPVAAPSLLLQRRPDIAAAERRVAAANARIGVARAALYPDLSINASGGYEAVIGTLIKSAGLIWAVGPGFVTAPVFDGGRREGEVQRTVGVLREAAADYRQTVLDAFRQVEDALAEANHLAVAEAREDLAVTAAIRTDHLATVEYQDGAVDYLQVVVAQTAELATRGAAITITTTRLRAEVDLVRALGGGWKA